MSTSEFDMLMTRVESVHATRHPKYNEEARRAKRLTTTTTTTMHLFKEI